MAQLPRHNCAHARQGRCQQYLSVLAHLLRLRHRLPGGTQPASFRKLFSRGLVDPPCTMRCCSTLPCALLEIWWYFHSYSGLGPSSHHHKMLPKFGEREKLLSSIQPTLASDGVPWLESFARLKRAAREWQAVVCSLCHTKYCTVSSARPPRDVQPVSSWQHATICCNAKVHPP